MSTTESASAHELDEALGSEHGRRVVTVSVNARPVVFEEHRQTGASVKSTAIAQGVPIQQDFALFEVKGQGRLIPVMDDEQVTLHPRQQFRAVAPDDNS
jgi:hypothetical protein